ncbi:hypothetical protein ACNANV_16215 [Curtobacterium flaccumfaciens pv. flaccumfaciens]|uniref:hypothetical protein n=1 Tax=Curtobacterium flaccumfaciens TaxID=2035 RepID=UPI003A4E38D5
MPLSATKIAPEAGQGFEGTIHNIPAGDTMNKTVLTVADAYDIHWREIDSDAIVLVPCNEPGCYIYGTPHLLKWGDLLQHKAFVASATDVRVEVAKFAASEEVPEAESHWYVSGFLCDDDIRLTPERVAFFTAHYNSAVALAAELNGESH